MFMIHAANRIESLRERVCYMNENRMSINYLVECVVA